MTDFAPNATIDKNSLIDESMNRVEVIGVPFAGIGGEYIRVRFEDGTENSFPVEAVIADDLSVWEPTTKRPASDWYETYTDAELAQARDYWAAEVPDGTITDEELFTARKDVADELARRKEAAHAEALEVEKTEAQYQVFLTLVRHHAVLMTPYRAIRQAVADIEAIGASAELASRFHDRAMASGLGGQAWTKLSSGASFEEKAAEINARYPKPSSFLSEHH